MSSVAVFWDRDNTLIEDPGYISDPGQVKLLPGAAEALQRLSAAGFENIIITNQSGVARGYFDEAALQRVHDRLVALFTEQGAKIDAIYFCPFLAGDEAKIEKYRKDSELRKPKPGMIFQAALERKIELAGSWMIGDKVQDAQAGRAAGCRTILIRRPGDAHPARKGGDVDFAVDSIAQAAATVVKYTRRAGSTPSRPSAPPTAAPPPAVERPAELAPSAKRGVEPAPEPRVPDVVRDGEAMAPDEPTPEPPVVVQRLAEPAPTANQGVVKVPELPTAMQPAVEPAPTPKPAPAEAPKPPTEARPAESTPSAAELAPSAKRGVDTPTEPPPAKKRPESQLPTDATALLQEILIFLRMVDRRSRVDEFALGKLLGAIAQIVAIGALTWSLFGLIREEPIADRLGFAILFQLMALTCFILSPRK